MAHGSRLMAHDSWLMAHDSWLMAHGSWLMAKENLPRGPGPGGPRGKFFIGHEPDAMSTRVSCGGHPVRPCVLW